MSAVGRHPLPLSLLLLGLAAVLTPPSHALVRVFRLLENQPAVLRTECYELGGQLAVIEDAQAQARALHAASTQSPLPFLRVRLGAKIYSAEEGFSWVDGTGFFYTNWAPGQPDNYRYRGEECIEMITGTGRQRGKWNDQLCDVIPLALCELQSKHKYRVMRNHMASIAHLCYANGGRLAQINSDRDQRTALQVIREAKSERLSGPSVRLGARVAAPFSVIGRKRNHFVWPTEQLMAYANWAPLEPNNQALNEACVELQLDQYGRWNDVPCHEPYLALCKIVTDYNTTYRVVRNKPKSMQRWCFDQGGFLATVRDTEEQDAAVNAIRSNYNRALKLLLQKHSYIKARNDVLSNFKLNFQRVLLGARRLDAFTCPEHLFAWVIKEAPMNYTKWLPGQPTQHKGENCVEMMRSGYGGWNDVECFQPRLALCEYEEVEEPLKTYRVIQEDGLSELRHYNFWEEQCRHRGGLLAKIGNEMEQRLAEKAVRRLRLGNEKILLGATQTRYYPRYFAWLDGTRLEYTRWANETRDEDDDCVSIITSGRNLGRWRATGCRAAKVLCQFSRNTYY